MPHIDLPEGLPGISAGFAYRPETAKPMRELAHILLHEPGTLARGERELIACFVSSRNKTYFCEASHRAAATAHLGDASIVEEIKRDFYNGSRQSRAQGSPGNRGKGPAGRQAGHQGRCRSRAQPGRHRP